MIHFFKKYKTFGIGALLLGVIVWCLSAIGFVRIPKDEPLENILIFGFWWLAISFPLYHINYLKKKKKLLVKGLVLVVVFITTLGVDTYFNIPDHPLVISLVVVFWLGACYLFFPSFFMKYRKWIVIPYGLILAYFIYLRLDENYLELYHNRVINALILPIPIILLLWLYEQWKWFRTLKSEKTKAELDFLKTQVNPHFFFNTLNNLYSLTIKQSEKAPEVILKLSEMMRYTIYEGKKDWVPLEEELVYLKNYIALHEIRHHKNVEIQFEHHVLPNDEVPPLLFIILLENAFKHGVEKLVKEAYVHIGLISTQEQVHFSIENNFEQDTEQLKEGIGLENLKRRLALLYPDTHTLRIQEEEPRYKVDLILNKR